MVNHVGFAPLIGATEAARGAPARQSQAGETFAAVLEKTAAQPKGGEPVKFSAHASRRLQDRGILLTAADKASLANAVDSAAAKGARETLVITSDTSLVVSVANRTVITAVPHGESDNTVFTNIDSAVVVSDETSAMPQLV